MLVAKLLDHHGAASFWEVKAVADEVRFDPRPGWVLLAAPIGARPRKQTELCWKHQDDVRFEWVRRFDFPTVPG